MHSPYPHLVRNQQLWLSNERCIFWENQQLLILSDTHLGKTGHFRKEGIALPQDVFQADLDRLTKVIQHFQPQGVLIVGDLFHSRFNKEIRYFQEFRENISSIKLELIRGNHDVLSDDIYEELSIQVHHNPLYLPPFCFVHDYHDMNDHRDHYIFCGHLHPGIEMRGKAKQKLRLPCFHFTEHYACLPAFSKFTGISCIEVKKSDQVFLITDDEVISN